MWPMDCSLPRPGVDKGRFKCLQPVFYWISNVCVFQLYFTFVRRGPKKAIFSKGATNNSPTEFVTEQMRRRLRSI